MVWLILGSVAIIAFIVSASKNVPSRWTPPERTPQNPETFDAHAPTKSVTSGTPVATPAAAIERFTSVTPLADKPVLPARSTSWRWIAFGEPVAFSSTTIRGGGFYFGGDDGRPRSPKAPRIDPSLRLQLHDLEWSGERLGYYPSYPNISSAQRGTLIAFLHSKREFPQVGIGYVFLYFYGLERRLLIDAQTDAVARAEVPTLLAELNRLIDRYGSNSSFHHYATTLRDLAQLAYADDSNPPDSSDRTWSIKLRAHIGVRLRDQQSLTPLEAFSVARASTPEASRGKWDIVVDDMSALYAIRYTRTYPNGLVIKAPKTKIAIDYRWASPDGGPHRFAFDIPDAASVTTPYRPLYQLMQNVLLDMEPLRRIRRSKTRTLSAELAATPTELIGKTLPIEVATLRDEIHTALVNDAHAPFPIITLVRGLALPAGALTKRAATSLVQSLESLGIGVEPDPRFHGILSKPDGDATLFKLTADAPRQPSPAYTTALLLAQAAMAIAATSDGIQASEVDALIRGIERQFALMPAEHARLQAHVDWLQREPPSLARIEAKARLLPETDRAAFAQVLVDIAAADGNISPSEVRLLERLYKALGLDTTRIHADLHHASVGVSNVGRTVRGSPLSADAIAAKLADTHRVQTVLSRIFENDAESESKSAADPHPVAPEATGSDSAGLDAAHRALLRAILTNQTTSIPRGAFEAWCEPHELLAEGAIELLNDAAFNAAGEALLEGEDPVEINIYAAEQLRAAGA